MPRWHRSHLVPQDYHILSVHNGTYTTSEGITTNKENFVCKGVKTFYSDTPSFISLTLFEFLCHLLSLHSSPISDPGHILSLLFKILSSEVPNQIIFHVLWSVNNSYNSLNTNSDGHLTYIILLIFPPSMRWVSLYCFASKMHFFKKSH